MNGNKQKFHMENLKKYVTISVAAFICYCNTLWGSFVFDDTEAIVKNKDIMPHTPWTDIFQNDFWGSNISYNSSHKSYRPLTILSYRLNVLYSNNKLDAFQFHATNVILYGLLCLLSIPVFELFLRKRRKQRTLNETAYLSSLLFTVHPVHTESVAGLVGRADILSSILFFVVILLYDKTLATKSFLLFILIVLLTAAAVLCKETAITVLAMCIVYDVFLQKKKRIKWTEIFDVYFCVRTSLLVVAGIVILFYRLKIMNFEGPTFTSIDNPAAYAEKMYVRIFSYNYIYFINFLLLLWPQWLCFDWSMGCIPLIEDVHDARLFLVILLLGISLSTSYSIISKITTNKVFFRDARLLGFSLIILPFIPASNLFLKVGFVVAERTLLLPSAGFCLLVVMGLKRIENLTPQCRAAAPLAFYVVCMVFMLRSIQRNSDWLAEEKLFSSALDVCPLNAKVHYNIAKIAADNNNKDLALYEYKKAIDLNPQYEQAMNNLANLLREDKHFEEAEVLLRKALVVRPNFAAAWMNLGIVLTNLNRTEEAERCYKTAILHRRKYPDCYYNLGNLYLDLKRSDEALEAWEMAVHYRPLHVAAWSNTLVLLDSMRQYDKVLELGKTALIHNPRSPALHFSIANTLGKIQQFEKAEGHFLQAINMNSSNALYYSNLGLVHPVALLLGVLYHRWGKVDKAREMYKKALEIDHSMKTTQLNLQKLLQVQG